MEGAPAIYIPCICQKVGSSPITLLFIKYVENLQTDLTEMGKQETYKNIWEKMNIRKSRCTP